jgi:hypothetical protein
MSKNSLAVKEENIPGRSLAFMEEDSGKGLSFAAEDNIVPLIYTLQALSPAVNKRNSAYVEGAEPGDFLKKNSIHGPLVKGTEGMLFQPCYFEKVWIEWKPNRGGFAGIHKERPVDAMEKEIIIEGKPRKAWMRDNGNTVIETRQHVGLADGEPYVISLSSSGHTVSRQWMQMMNQQYLPGKNKIAASWAKKYRLTTMERSNNSGQTWFVIKPEDLGDSGWVNEEEYMRGKQLYQAFSRGEKEAAVAEEHTNDDSVPF